MDVVFCEGDQGDATRLRFNPLQTGRCVYIRKREGEYLHHTVFANDWKAPFIHGLSSWIAAPYVERADIKNKLEHFMFRFFKINLFLESVGDKTLSVFPIKDGPVRSHVVLYPNDLCFIVNHLRERGNPVIPAELLEEHDREYLGQPGFLPGNPTPVYRRMLLLFLNEI